MICRHALTCTCTCRLLVTVHWTLITAGLHKQHLMHHTLRDHIYVYNVHCRLSSIAMKFRKAELGPTRFTCTRAHETESNHKLVVGFIRLHELGNPGMTWGYRQYSSLLPAYIHHQSCLSSEREETEEGARYECHIRYLYQMRWEKMRSACNYKYVLDTCTCTIASWFGPLGNLQCNVFIQGQLVSLPAYHLCHLDIISYAEP